MTSPMETTQETSTVHPDASHPASPLKTAEGAYASEGKDAIVLDHTGSPATSADPAAAALKQCWDVVDANPDDFAAWEALIRTVESPPGGLTPEAPAQNFTSLREAYDRFLARFPLCFGYWKKYADNELAIAGAEAAEKVFERGVAAISNSVDLWTQYCSFKVELFKDDVEGIRKLFERGAEAVGLDFLAHLFWDRYLEYEESMGAADQVLAILKRVILMPMHQYARYFDKYTHVYSERPLAEAVGEEHLAEIEKEVREADPSKPEEEINQQVRLRVHAIKSEIYNKTQEETLKRWVFEQEIKRPYFHVRPLDDAQLANWAKYLQFEEAQAIEKSAAKELAGEESKVDPLEPTADRVALLFERCLVACALYEDFWDRYAKYLLRQGKTEDAYRVYDRALSVHIGPKKSTLRLSYALVLEKDGKAEEARDIYKALMKNLPGHVESIVQYAHFERRQASSKPYEEASRVIREALELESLESASRGFLYGQLANLAWRNLAKGSVVEARKIFKEAIAAVVDSKYLWLNYLNFEMAQTSKTTEEHVQEVFDLIRTTSTLPESTLKEFAQRNLDFLLERGVSAERYLEVEKAMNAPPAPAAPAAAADPAESNKKRTATDTDADHDAKRTKMEEDTN